ncbi:MAG: ATP-dependent helicase HrpB [Proteobacteria bacterium]|nr:ATP-dependent helicase HrpB [Pseudomonadota bacterium]MBU1581461.1 ATP-dependent helicase HrpB [Pseudomonadota bacterium]MBU2454330.1 ATP-dependent helicase HrpB [Pseudomonadota bacterium]MBU2627326.1 ATP-dependent helicase HrpB [Pseudomonadota bacterium]
MKNSPVNIHCLLPRHLPIQHHIFDIKKALETAKCAVIEAPPGAGKTTRVPLALLNEPWLGNKKIILLEPRRLAAISCATHMADLLKEKVGQTIGYQIRLDKKIGPGTRIEVITEGIFTRKIQNDPCLEDIGLVIFDEFHERNIHSDLGFALCLESFEVLRHDLRILVMSATMDVGAVSALMNTAPVIISKGKSFPVKTIYIPAIDKQNRRIPIETACVSAIRRALLETNGDMLVFLPGVREIKSVSLMLEENLDSEIHVIPLYGNLSQKEQALAFHPPEPGERKIILATAIAETSITIEGIRVVIDSGLMRVPRFSFSTGMSLLATIPVSKAAADQRRGRAGRTAPGRCYRLWSLYDQKLLKPFTTPEILSVDLTGVALELAAWGISDPGQLKWLDLPEEKPFEQARHLLQTLGALDEKGCITTHGKKMVSVGLHPRLAHMVIKADEIGQGLLACRIAALLTERDFIGFDHNRVDPDIRLRLELIETVGDKKKTGQKEIRVNKKILYRIMESEKKLIKDFGIPPTRPDLEMAGKLLAHAYPDRIAKKRNHHDNTFLTTAGKGAFFTEKNRVSINEYIIALHLDGNPKNAKIFLAAPYSRQDLEQDFKDFFKTVPTAYWNRAAGLVQSKEEIVFEKIVVQHRILSDIDPDVACDILIQEIQAAGLGLLPWTKKLTCLKDRTAFLKNTGQFPDLPDVSNLRLEATLAVWLKPFLSGVLSLKQLEKIDLTSAFLSLLTWEQQQTIEKMAPSHITVPSGSKKPLIYSKETGMVLDAPVLEVRLQEMFGLCSTPKIAGSTLPVVLHLLSPAGRPVQITTDLESFWGNTYKAVKKDLMGRYPKHFWPDDPHTAMPTNRVKKKNRSK